MIEEGLLLRRKRCLRYKRLSKEKELMKCVMLNSELRTWAPSHNAETYEERKTKMKRLIMDNDTSDASRSE